MKNGFGDAALVLFGSALVGTEQNVCDDIYYYKVYDGKFHVKCLLINFKPLHNSVLVRIAVRFPLFSPVSLATDDGAP